jgi:hypothetical protein
MERAVGAGGSRPPPIGGAQRSEAARGEVAGGGPSSLRSKYEDQDCKSWRSFRETIFRMHLALTASAYGELSGAIIICSQSGFSESLENGKNRHCGGLGRAGFCPADSGASSFCCCAGPPWGCYPIVRHVLSNSYFRRFSKAGAEVRLRRLGPYPVLLDEIGESRGFHRTVRSFRDRVDQLVQLMCCHPCACSHELPTKRAAHGHPGRARC